MENEKIKVLIKAPNKVLEEVCIDNTYYSFRDIVGGNIEYMPFKNLYEKGIEVIVNDEFLINGSDISFAYGNSTFINGIVAGNAIFVSSKGDETHSLNEEQINFIKNLFANYFAYDRQGRLIPVMENY